MSTIKISQLPLITQLNANTANTLFVAVDVPSDTTGKFTATTLAAGLYSNNALVVGVNPIVFTNTIAQFSGVDPSFTQVNLQNFSNTGAGDMIITADTGTNANAYIDLGLNNSQWNAAAYGQTSQFAYDGYLVVQGPGPVNQGNLVIGTAVAGANLVFAVGGQYANNISATITANGLVLNTQSYIVFADGTSQTTAVSNTFVNANDYSTLVAAKNYANSVVSVQTGTLSNTVNVVFNQANAAFAEANAAFAAGNTLSGTVTIVSGVANVAAYNASSGWLVANSASSNTVVTQGVDATQNTSITAAFIQANSAYNQANTANANAAAASSYANSAFLQANSTTSNSATVGSYANSAFIAANSAGAYANSAFTVANNAIANSAAASAYANSAYTQANTATSNAAAGSAYANSAFIVANNATSNAAAASAYANSAFIVANNATSNAAAASAYANSAYAQANTATNNAAAGSSYANSAFTAANSASSNANSAGSYANSAFSYANTQIAILFGIDTTQNTSISNNIIQTALAYNQANLANSIANTAVQNTANILLPGNVTFNGANTNFNSNIITYGTMTTTGNVVTTGNLTATGPVIFNGLFTNNGNTINNGNMTTTGNVVSVGTLTANGTSTFNGNTTFNGSVAITNNLSANTVFTINVPLQTLTMNGTVTIQNSNFPANVSGIRIDGSNNGIAQQTTSSGTMLQVTGLDGGYATRVIIDNYNFGNTAAYPLIAGRAARGNSSNPTPVLAGDILIRWGGNGYGNTFGLTGGATIDYLAAENYTDTTKGSTIAFNTTQTGTNNRTTTATLNTSVFAVSSNTITANTIIANTYAFSNTSNTGVVTQSTNKSTSVTANGTFGQIIMNNAGLGSGAYVTFTVNNSYVQHVNDVPFVAIQNPVTTPNPYLVSVGGVRVGSFDITIINNAGGGPKTDAIVLNWALMRVGS